MRTLVEHKVNEANEQLKIEVIDEPGAGGANHHYKVTGYNPVNGEVTLPESTLIAFQNGPIKESGVNGLTQEVLLAICADRLRSFQAGQFACRENAIALTHIETAQMWLQTRTRDRLLRGVEGTHFK
jgi:hypothetical protein